jgi:hypothetical protein
LAAASFQESALVELPNTPQKPGEVDESNVDCQTPNFKLNFGSLSSDDEDPFEV